jgi:hypothetical protein
MANWLNDLADHASAKSKSAKAKKAQPKPAVHQVIVTTRPSDETIGDPGACRVGFYFVQGDLLTMCSEDGQPIKNSADQPITAVLASPSDAHGVAASLTRKRARGDGMRGFDKGPLRYRDEGWR